MLTQASYRFRLWQGFTLLLLGSSFFTLQASTAIAQGSPELAKEASLTVSFGENGAGFVTMSLTRELPPDVKLDRALSEAMGVALGDMHIYTKEMLEEMAREATEYADEVVSEEGFDFGYSLIASFNTNGQGAEGFKINLAPLLEAIRPASIEWLDVVVTHPQMSGSHCRQTMWATSATELSIGYHYVRLSVNDPAQILLTIGYSPVSAGDYAKVIIAVLLVILAPVLLTLWMRRRALRLYKDDATTAWFRFFRSQNYIIHATWLVWLAALPAFKLSSYLDLYFRSLPPVIEHALDVGLYFLPPVIVGVVCSVLSHSVHSRIRGEQWTKRDLMQQAIWSQAVGSLPFLCLMVGLGLIASGWVRLGILWIVAGIATIILASKRVWKSQDLEPHSLTVGELRDHIFALAEKAGVKLKQIYILPGAKGRMMNAFATPGNQVMLTHYLLKNLSRREVDAVVAHEVSHLKHNHTSKRGLALAVSFAVCMVFGIYLESFASDIPFYSICIAFSFVAFHYFARKYEYEADVAGVSLTGDPEALVTALTKLARVSHMPLQWSRFDEAMLTHPSTLNRAKAIARVAGITDDRLQEVMQLPAEDQDRYELPPAVTSDEKLFSTSFKNSANAKATWAIIAAAVLTPILAAQLSMAADWPETIRLGILALGALATVAVVAVALNYMPVTGCRKLHSQFRARLNRDGINPEEFGGVFVGLSPAAEPRLYENNFIWDMGFLLFAGDKLCYVGEQAGFALKKAQVTSVRLGEGPRGWFSSRRVYISWLDEETGARGVFHVTPCDVRCLTEVESKVLSLHDRICSWREKRSWPVALPEQYVGLNGPNIGPVTSAAPSEVIGTQQFIASLLIVLLIAFTISILFGLSFSLSGGAGWYVPLVSMLVAAIQRIPYWLEDETGEARNRFRPGEQEALQKAR